MSQQPPPSATKKCRVSVTLPADTLAEARRIARARHVRLSTIVAEALAYGLQSQTAAERSQDIGNGYLKAFSGLSDDEMMILDGIILEPDATCGTQA